MHRSVFSLSSSCISSESRSWRCPSLWSQLLEYMHHKQSYKTYAQLEWTTKSTLQLHRLVHDGTYNKAPTWSHCVNTVPTTDPEVDSAGLDIEDIKHPMLQTAASSTDSVATASSHTVSRPSRPNPQTIHSQLNTNEQYSSPGSSTQNYFLPSPVSLTPDSYYCLMPLLDNDSIAESPGGLPVSSVPSHHEGAGQTSHTPVQEDLRVSHPPQFIDSNLMRTQFFA